MFAKASLYAALLSQALPALGAVHEQLTAGVPSGWAVQSTPDDSSAISLSVGLAQQNIDQLETKLLAVSTPGSTTYGQHLDIDDVNALFAPSSDAVSAVQSWLSSAGVTSTVSSDSQWVSFATTVGTANKLLNTTFLTYENSGVLKLRTTQYSVPDPLVDHIDLVQPTVYFGKTVAQVPTLVKKEPPSKRQVDASCQISITPKCLKELYSVGTYIPDPKSGAKIGFGSFLNQSALYDDLFEYETLNNIPFQNFSVELINGGVNDQDEATAQVGEADLDVQNIVGVSHPMPVTEYITGGSPPVIADGDEPPGTNTNEPYLPYYQYLLSKPNSELPQVITNSYGDDEDSVPYKYAVRVCNMIGMLGLRGITVLESSGDLGVGSACLPADGIPRFTPIFPATCPYILSVGGTVAATPEVAWSSSSGGFSDYFKRPLYQETAVETYLNSHISPATKQYYNAFTNFSGRGFPDVAAHSVSPNYQVVYDMTISPSGGTSAASPVVAAIVALLNDARFRAGKTSPLGFINPLLYAIGFTALTDITSGTAVGCNGIDGQDGLPSGGVIIPFATWNATQGWDPVTGLGTPNFEKLKALALSLP